MKKLLSVMVAVAMLMSTLLVFADETPEHVNISLKIEISFRVGDSILSINGTEVEVETPYVAGEGTTLVPLRVITEAFGATVDWVDETQTITLEYPDVNITLQIGNIIANVNDHKETLLEAPVLSDNGFTMVPLRFISETFGATVSYDDATESILVTKESITGGETVHGITDKDFIGDSYYGWTMNTPKDMTMATRNFDGSITQYVADNEDYITLNISRTSDNDLTFDEYFTKVKDSFSNYTLSRSDKLKDASGNQYYVLEAKNKTNSVIFYSFHTDDFFFDIVGMCKVDNSDFAESRASISDIVDSFRLTSSFNDNVHDLSDVENGFRKFTDETYKVSMKLPAELYQVTSAENEFLFRDKDAETTFSLEIYSIDNTTNAKSLAQNDHDLKVPKYNEKLTTISDVTSEDGVYKYTITTSGSVDYDRFIVDRFFELGDYVYNVSITVSLSKGESYANSLIDTIEVEELDKSVIGNLLRGDNDPNATISVNTSDYTFSIPETWKVLSTQPYSALTSDTQSTGMISFKVENGSDIGPIYISGIAESYINRLPNEYKKEKPVSKININNIEYAKFTLKSEKNGSYSTFYMGKDNDKILLITLLQSDINYGGNNEDVLLQMVKSIKAK